MNVAKPPAPRKDTSSRLVLEFPFLHWKKKLKITGGVLLMFLSALSHRGEASLLKYNFKVMINDHRNDTGWSPCKSNITTQGSGTLQAALANAVLLLWNALLVFTGTQLPASVLPLR